jgi:hypothetical protein
VLAREYVAPRPIRELRDDLPTGLLTVIDRMLSRMPGDRFQAPGEVTKALAPFARPAPPSKPETVQAPPMAANTTPPPDAPIVDIATTAPQNFLARCPFCLTRIRIPARVLGASLPCPHCGSYFTAVPEEDSGTRQER